eukprot:CAMPEP_0172455496 /NCGR_PEP_ID=MMETSP1065-20121228/12092_1 /TAXON_ID=265537 /ORGANISM="Amphiprora paludosa, Strain CCMP125" /LENGTH=592 /DNA_ID=CAMNT_0013207957 /DNA_START=41 /DNA_END=1819 /DNA_ORIENTATION=+
MTAPSSSGALGRFDNIQIEFVAIILAATVGTRLFPLTDASAAGTPKHLLPVAGVSILQRQLHALQKCGFAECVVAISHEDENTMELLRTEIKEKTMQELDISKIKEMGPSTNASAAQSAGTSNDSTPDFSSASVCMQVRLSDGLKVTIVRLGEEIEGSVGAITQIESAGVVSPQSHIVILPGDLVLFDGLTEETKETNPGQQALAALVHAHRQAQTTENAAACTLLLSDFGEQDENGVPLKESSKQKKGGYARDQEDIEYIALTYPERSHSNEGTAPRVVWKQSKMEAEEDKDMTGQTPKLEMPKPRLRLGQLTRVRTDWTDVHVYVLSPWVRQLLLVRNNIININDPQQAPPEVSASLISLADDLLPLLITRQFLSIQETFGSKMEPTHIEDLLQKLSTAEAPGVSTAMPSVSPPGRQPIAQSSSGGVVTSDGSDGRAKKGYLVQAHVQKTAFRSATIPAYLYASKEMVAKSMEAGNSSRELLLLPPNSTIRHKFQTVLLPDTVVGDKVTFKSAVVGRNCKLGSKCRLNSVILLDNVTLGDQVSLQNTVIGKGAVLGDNCSLNDCQVAPGKKIVSGTKAKSEVFTDESVLE